MCPDVYYALALSGEPPIPLIKSLFPKGELQPPIPLTKFENVTLHMKDFRERYLDYWMSTSTLTQTGVFMPFVFVLTLTNLL
jgi:amidase